MIRSGKTARKVAPGQRRGRCTLAAAAALATLVLVPVSADAAQVTLSGGTLNYQAAPGETNTPALVSASARFYVNDAAATLAVSGAGCNQPDPHTVSCPDTSVTRVVVDTGDGDDTIDLSLSWRPLPAQLDGGAGNDTIKGGAGDDRIDGGSGDDTMRGDGGADFMQGGDGIDTVTYAGRSTAVTVALDGTASDGSAGEGDNVAGDVENVIGTDLGDTLTGNASDNVLTGGPGPDTLDGAGGSDTLVGGDGDDAIAARDAQLDRVSCGLGADGVIADRADLTDADCELVDKPSEPVVTPLPASSPPPADVTAPAQRQPIVDLTPLPHSPAVLDSRPGRASPLPFGPTVALPREPVAVSAMGEVPLPVSCPVKAAAACAGYVTLNLLPSVAARVSRRGSCLTRTCKPPPRPSSGRIGSRHFLVRIGHIVRLQIGLSRYGQWKLRHDGRLRVRAESYSTQAGKTTRTGSSVITLLRSPTSRRTTP